MYMERVLDISKATNGFVVGCRVPLLPSKNGKKDYPVYVETTEKQYLAKDEAEVVAMVAKLLPLLDTEYKSDSAFEDAFNSAAGAASK